ncbi:hypothetical protein B9Z39_15900 [Limnohabitans sp. JirII-29]|uniref:hypothetical protein n=1 Tax=Limnohabitans sp. JirII-29 TaxID=1835756 RepID=UPI000D3ABA2E|nr:hypothetical protein [Limnohabitans sp. JirII-29]PUE23230.1 hypothetical protein B9Z39_15900 [Limnohabitans sp. JirII-29]
MTKFIDCFSNRYMRLFLSAALSLVLVYWYLPCPKGDVPAWIQAGGSVLAIIASFWIADANRKSEQQERSQRVFAVAKAAHEYAKKIRGSIAFDQQNDRFNSAIHDIYHRDVTRSFARALADIPFHEVGTSDVVQALLSMQVQFDEFLPNSIDALIKGPTGNPEFEGTRNDLDDLPPIERSIQRKLLRDRYIGVLVKNVYTHIDVIDANFEEVQRAIDKAH